MAHPASLSVRCLGCGSVYEKPLGEGTAADNPGCPKCGYVGWIPTEGALNEGSGSRRSGEDLQRDRSAPRR
jgi:predicted  nucleic acid-binding Zn-ribbon protein